MYYNNVIVGFLAYFVQGRKEAHVFTYTKKSRPLLDYGMIKTGSKHVKKTYSGTRISFSFSLQGSWEIQLSPTEAISHYINNKTPSKKSPIYCTFDTDSNYFFNTMGGYSPPFVYVTC